MTPKRTITTKKAALTTRSLAPDDWSAITQLFGDNGACGGCWCMHWRVEKGGASWELTKGRKNRDRFRRLVQAGKVHGVLAYADEKPVGWCSFGPKQDFPRLMKSKVLQTDCGEGTWSIICFYIPSAWRNRGVGTVLLECATKEAFARGAAAVEGYPVVPAKPPSPVPAAFAWTGVPILFEQAGYAKIRRPKGMRPIYVKSAT